MPRPTNQITYPTPPRPSHRRLLIGAVVVIILGGAFLFFWQTVLQFAFAPAPEWDLAYCNQLLGQHVPEIRDFELVPVPGENRTFTAIGTFYTEEGEGVTVRAGGIEEVVLSCEVEIVAATSGLQDVGDPYDCQGVIVNYNSEEAERWLLAGVRLENTIPGNPTPFIDLITYYNPAARQAFERRLGALRAHSCEI